MNTNEASPVTEVEWDFPLIPLPSHVFPSLISPSLIKDPPYSDCSFQFQPSIHQCLTPFFPPYTALPLTHFIGLYPAPRPGFLVPLPSFCLSTFASSHPQTAFIPFVPPSKAKSNLFHTPTFPTRSVSSGFQLFILFHTPTASPHFAFALVNCKWAGRSGKWRRRQEISSPIEESQNFLLQSVE